MTKFILRLDDACEKMDVDKWKKMEILLDQYEIKPLVGVIPNCQDEMMDKYYCDDKFWDKVHSWINKGWTIALHGYNHQYVTKEGGINPIHHRSEFAGVDLKQQKKMIRAGVNVFLQHGISPKVFFAPSHTFDVNTLKALKEESEIRIVSDTISYDVYNRDGITFVPQQSGKVRYLPFGIVTFCYHPNEMNDKDFLQLEAFLKRYNRQFIGFPLSTTKKKFGLMDRFLRFLYMVRR